MRSLIFSYLTIFALSLSSCSSDSSSDSGSTYPSTNQITFKVNGTQKIFNATVIEINSNYIQIKSVDDDNATEKVFFNIYPYETSNSDIQGFRYRTSQGDYVTNNTSFDNYTVNSNPNNKTSSGTFSGPLTLIGGNGATVNITEGRFSVKY